jgi:hypothetical protein
MATDIHNPNAWEPVVPPITSTVLTRAAMSFTARSTSYRAITAQFDVASNPRYVPGHDNDPKNGIETYCNIFLCDVMSALDVMLPHWMDPATGAPTAVGKGRETSANGVCTWLVQHGFAYLWMECGELKARDRATDGWPTCVVWNNPTGIGHVAVVLPGRDFTHIAQAGGTNFYDADVRKGFGGIPNLRYYTHD